VCLPGGTLPGMTQMKIQSIRFSELDWGQIQKEASVEGVSASQFVREAALVRVWFARALRGDSSEAHALAALFDAIREQR
jgi:hypothetical protein